ncbi:MAG: PAS domain-containing protein [Methanoregulaceae archaeon]
MTIREIAESLGANRISAAKYLDILQIQGMVDVRQRGSAKFYFPSHRFSFLSLQKFVRDWYLLLDNGGYVAAIHPGFLRQLHLSAPGVLGKRITVLGIPEILDPVFRAELKETIRGREPRERDLTLTILGGKYSFHIIFVPVIFGTGKAGGGIILQRIPEPQTSDMPLPEIPGSHIVYVSPEGRILAANDTCFRELKRPRDEIIGAYCHSFIPKEDWPLLSQYAEKATPENPVGAFEVRVVMSPGKIGWLRAINRAIYDNAGTLLGYISLNIDITARKKKEEQLQKSRDSLEKKVESQEQEFRYLTRQLHREISNRDQLEIRFRLTQFALDLSPDLILWLTPDGRVQYANPPVLDLLGYTTQMITSFSWDKFAVPYGDSEWSEIWSRTKEKLQYAGELSLIKANGIKTDVRVHFRYLNYGSQEYCFCFVRDISEKKEMMRRIALQEQHLATILNGIPDSVLALDTEKKVVVWNRALEELTGVPAKDMLGRGNGEHAVPVYGERSGMLLDLVFEDNPSILKKYQYIHRSGESLSSEKFFPKFRGGDDRSFRFTAFPMKGSNGEITGAFEAIRDITSREVPYPGEMKKVRRSGKDNPAFKNHVSV